MTDSRLGIAVYANFNSIYVVALKVTRALPNYNNKQWSHSLSLTNVAIVQSLYIFLTRVLKSGNLISGNFSRNLIYGNNWIGTLNNCLFYIIQIPLSVSCFSEQRAMPSHYGLAHNHFE